MRVIQHTISALLLTGLICLLSLPAIAHSQERASTALQGELPPHTPPTLRTHTRADAPFVSQRVLDETLRIRTRRANRFFACDIDRQRYNRPMFSLVDEHGVSQQEVGDIVTLSGQGFYRRGMRRVLTGSCAVTVRTTNRNRKLMEVTYFLNGVMFTIRTRMLANGNLGRTVVRRSTVPRTSDHMHPDGSPCGVHPDEHTLSHSSPESSGVQLRNTSIRVTEINIVADGLYTQKHGSAQNAIQRMLGDLNAASVFYAPMNISLEASEMVAYTPATDPLTTSTDAVTLLYDFRYKQPTGYMADLSHLWTARNIDGNTIGIAFVGTVCIYPWNVGLSQDYGNAATRAVLVAHEIGHNFSSQHDGSGNGCSTGSHVMSPWIVSGAPGFSQCSQNYINNFAANANCLTQHQDPPQVNYTISGTVRDSDGSPVTQALVEVQINGTTYSIYTDSFGGFSLDIIGPGFYDLTVTRNGFALYSMSGNVNSNISIDPVISRLSYEVKVMALDAQMNPVPGVQFVNTASGQGVTLNGNSQGFATFAVLHDREYAIVPTDPNCYFEQNMLEGIALGNHNRVVICR